MQYESYWSQEKTSYGHFFIKKHLSVQIGAYYRPDSTELYSQEYIIKAHSFSQIQQLHKCSAAKFWCHANTDWTQKLMCVKLKLLHTSVLVEVNICIHYSRPSLTCQLWERNLQLVFTNTVACATSANYKRLQNYRFVSCCSHRKIACPAWRQPLIRIKNDLIHHSVFILC